MIGYILSLVGDADPLSALERRLRPQGSRYRWSF